MPEKLRQHINVDELQQQLAVSQIARSYGYDLPPAFQDSGEQRMRCPCQDCQGHNDDRSVSINAGDPFKRWKCFRGNYGCGAKGNAVTLAYCMKHGRMPSNGKPTGREFYEIAEDLQAIASGSVPMNVARAVTREVRSDTAETLKQQPNLPLADSENEGARKLVNLDQQFTHDIKSMNSAASAYARRRPFLLSETTASQCRTGFMPGNSKSTLRGQWAFGVMDESGQPLAWVGRNVRYESERQGYESNGSQGREPAKYRFPKQVLFRRGLELYGQEFLDHDDFQDSLDHHGIILVEGFNDRIRLHELGVLSLGIMSNQITDEQVRKTAEFAKRKSDGRVGIMFDLDPQGEEGAKETLWKLHQERIQAYLVWTRKQLGEQFANAEPERLSDEEWQRIAQGK
jgi:5S rRNA maturation endonuclease (ribonuclease M5)